MSKCLCESFFQNFHIPFKYIELLIREKMMSGKILIEWRHRLCEEITRTRYMDVNSQRAMHIEIANIFFNQDTDDSDEITSEKSDSTGKSDHYHAVLILRVLISIYLLDCS